jgi:hypothetical protein
MKGKINELETNSKNKDIRGLYRGINEFQRDYQSTRTNLVQDENGDLLADSHMLNRRTNLVQDENGDLLADSHNMLNRWKNYSQEERNAYRIFVGKPERNRSLGRPKNRWLDNIKISLRKIWTRLI